MRHKCKAQKAANCTSKGYYKKERRDQLRKFAKRKLCDKLNGIGVHKESRKRGPEADEQCFEPQAPKRQLMAPVNDLPTQNRIQTQDHGLRKSF